MSNALIYHIAEKINWERAKSSNSYSTASLDSEGFIHMSTAQQLASTYLKYYRNKSGLVVLEIDPMALGDQLKWEKTPEGEGPFPHLYGTLHTNAVLDTYDLTEELLIKITKKSG